MNSVEQPGAEAVRTGIDRRTMLKAAVASGVVAGTWVAPRIESLGFAPAGAFTPCVVLSPEAQDKEQNSGNVGTVVYCPTPGPTCCGASFGNAGQIDRFTFNTPVTGCAQIVVRTISLNCNTTNAQPFRNPDLGQFAVVIESTSGEAACSQCQVLEAVLIDPSMGRTVVGTVNNGPSGCLQGGINASLPCGSVPAGYRLAVRLTCTIQTGECDPP